MNEPNLVLILQVALLYTLLAISPGANFVVISNTALSHSARAAIAVGAGVSTASVIWSGLAMAGFGAMLLAWRPVFATIQVSGALYLIYMGVHLLLNSRTAVSLSKMANSKRSCVRWYFLGLATNLTNPKTLVFFLSVFSVLFAKGVSIVSSVVCLLVIASISVGWNCLVAVVFSVQTMRDRYAKVKPLADATAGLCLAYFGIRLLIDWAMQV